MTHSPAEVALGGAVLAAAVGFGVYAMSHGGLRMGGDSYQLTASFRSVEGITVGSDVRLAGVKVGSVTAIALNPQTFRADTVVTLDTEVLVPDDSAIIIASEGLLGGSFVEISPGGSPFHYGPGEEILDTQGAVSLFTLLMRYFTGSEE